MRLGSQLRLALFCAGYAACTAQAEVLLEVGAEQFASAGFLKPEHWLDQHPNQNDRTNWLAQRTTAAAGYKLESWRFGIAREQQAYARANTGALVMAAQDKARHEVDRSSAGSFPIHAEVWKLNTTTFSAAYAWRPTPDVSVELEPFLQTIHDFEHSRADLLLVNSGASSQLTGQVSKTGTQSYGFLVYDRPDQGWGSGLNMRMQWHSAQGQLSLTVLNLWNQQQFSPVHQMSRQYNVAATGNKIQIADLPSITGQYGLTQERTRLPAFWRTVYEPVAVPGVVIGAMGLGQSGVWTAGYSGGWFGGRWWVQTAQTSNWFAGYGRSWDSGWRASFSVSTDSQGKAPLLSSVLVGKRW